MRLRYKLVYNLLGIGSTRVLILLLNLFLIVQVSAEVYGDFSYTYSTITSLSGLAFLGFNIAVPKNAKKGLQDSTIGFLVSHSLLVMIIILMVIAYMTSVVVNLPEIILSLGFILTNIVIIIANALGAQESLSKISLFFILGFALGFLLFPDDILFVPALSYASSGIGGLFLMKIRLKLSLSYKENYEYYLIVKDSLVVGIGTILSGVVITVSNEIMLSSVGTSGFADIGVLRQIQSIALIIPSLIFPVLISERNHLILNSLKLFRFASFILIITLMSVSLFGISERFELYLGMLIAVALSVVGLLLSPLLRDYGSDKFMLSNAIWSVIFGSTIFLLKGTLHSFVYATFFAYLIQLIYFLYIVRKEIKSTFLDILSFLVLSVISICILMC
jgi:O-antigen/teichoic acid export membrane protein